MAIRNLYSSMVLQLHSDRNTFDTSIQIRIKSNKNDFISDSFVILKFVNRGCEKDKSILVSNLRSINVIFSCHSGFVCHQYGNFKRVRLQAAADLPSNVCMSLPVAMSNMLMMPSIAPLAMYLPSGLCQQKNNT